MRDEIGIACARIASAFDALLGAALARLTLYYAARFSGLALCLPRDQQAVAMANLRQERDAAITSLRDTMRRQRDDAMRRARSPIVLCCRAAEVAPSRSHALPPVMRRMPVRPKHRTRRPPPRRNGPTP